MKNLTVLLMPFLAAIYASGQVVSDRFGFINSTEIVPQNSLQIEAGHCQSSLDYGSPFLRNNSDILLRHSTSGVHEFRLGYMQDPHFGSNAANYKIGTLGVKLKVTDFERLKIASIATLGVDIRTIVDVNRKPFEAGPSYYLQLELPVEYKLTERTSIQGELRQNIAVGLFASSPAFRQTRGAVKQTGVNIGLRKKIGSYVVLLPGWVNQFILSQSGDNGERFEWAELSYASIAAQVAVSDAFLIDVGFLRNVFTGKNQFEPAEGIVVQGGITFLLKHRSLRTTNIFIPR